MTFNFWGSSYFHSQVVEAVAVHMAHLLVSHTANVVRSYCSPAAAAAAAAWCLQLFRERQRGSAKKWRARVRFNRDAAQKTTSVATNECRDYVQRSKQTQTPARQASSQMFCEHPWRCRSRLRSWKWPSSCGCASTGQCESCQQLDKKHITKFGARGHPEHAQHTLISYSTLWYMADIVQARGMLLWHSAFPPSHDVRPRALARNDHEALPLRASFHLMNKPTSLTTAPGMPIF